MGAHHQAEPHAVITRIIAIYMDRSWTNRLHGCCNSLEPTVVMAAGHCRLFAFWSELAPRPRAAAMRMQRTGNSGAESHAVLAYILF